MGPDVSEKLRRCSTTSIRAFSTFAPGAVWAAGELLTEYNGDFNKYVGCKDIVEAGRHSLPPPAAADPLACGEFRPLSPPDLDPAAWRYDLDEVVDQLTASCRGVDPTSTDQVLET